jgi:hypothetical protein
MNLTKQITELTHKTFHNYSQAYTEADIIVPDTKPDIGQILQSDANAYITSKQITGDKIILEGKADITTLYLAEGGGVRSIFTHHTFKHTIDAKGNDETSDICDQINIQNVEAFLVNSRKFCVKILMGVEISLIVAQELEFTTGLVESLEEQNPIHHHFQKHVSQISANYHRRIAESEFMVREALEVPAGKASINEVLRVDVSVVRHESKAAGNKVLVKGDVIFSTMYLADDETVHSMEHQLPFSEIVSAIHEIADNAEVLPDFHVLNVAWVPQADADGEMRLFGVDVSLRASVTAEQTVALEALDDVYSTRTELEAELSSVSVMSQIERASGAVTIADIVRIDEGSPEIGQLYNVTARPQVAHARIEGSKIVIEGHIALNALYFSNTADKPVGTLNKELKFMHTFETTSRLLHENMVCDVRSDMTHISYSLNMAGEIDLRAVVSLEAQVLEQKEYKYVTDIKEIETDNETMSYKPYCLRIYFVKKGDTAWSIAKRYRIPVEDLIERNGEEFTVGQRLILQG